MVPRLCSSSCSAFRDVYSVLFLFYRLHVYAFAINSMVHCGSAFKPGASGLPYYCTPPFTVPDVIGARAVWQQNTHKKKNFRRSGVAETASKMREVWMHFYI